MRPLKVIEVLCCAPFLYLLTGCICCTSCTIECKGPDVVLFKTSAPLPYAQDKSLVYARHYFRTDSRDTIVLELYKQDTVFIETSLGDKACSEFREAHFSQFIYDATSMQIQNYVLAGHDNGKTQFLAFDVGPYQTKSELHPIEYDLSLNDMVQTFDLNDGTQIRFRSDSGIVWMRSEGYEMERLK